MNNGQSLRPLHSLAWLIALASAGCARSCKEDRPYVPYSIDAPAPAPSSPSAASAPVTVPTVDGSLPGVLFSPIKAQRAAEGAASIAVDGATVAAPAGKVFQWFVRADYDGDGTVDVAAWVQPKQPGAGELIWAKRNPGGGFAASATLTQPPASLQAPEGCKLEPELSLVGPHTLAVSIAQQCGEPASAARVRWIAVAMPTRQPATRLELSLEAQAGDELAVQVDASDRDGDLLDDVTVVFAATAEAAPFEVTGPVVGAELHYFDRPAGLSRDPHEPETSLRAHAARLGRSAKKKGSLAEVASGVRRLHRLHELLCEEPGAPAIKVQGQPLQCGASGAIGEADLAEIDAALKAPDVMAALAAEERMERAGALTEPRKLSEARARLDKGIAWQNVDTVEIAVAPLIAPADAPGWGALSFAADGALLVRQNGAVRRVEPGAAQASPEAPGAWPMAVTSPDASVALKGVVDPGDGTPLRARFRQGSADKDVVLPVMSPVGRAGARSPSQPWVVPISWGAAGLELLVNDVPVRIPSDLAVARSISVSGAQAPTASGPRSPDGKWLVVPSPVGLVVVGDKAAVWKNARLNEAHRKLRDCTVANDASAAACVEGNKVIRVVPKARDGG
jgi:hypothetical protein